MDNFPQLAWGVNPVQIMLVNYLKKLIEKVFQFAFEIMIFKYQKLSQNFILVFQNILNLACDDYCKRITFSVYDILRNSNFLLFGVDLIWWLIEIHY